MLQLGEVDLLLLMLLMGERGFLSLLLDESGFLLLLESLLLNVLKLRLLQHELVLLRLEELLLPCFLLGDSPRMIIRLDSQSRLLRSRSHFRICSQPRLHLDLSLDPRDRLHLRLVCESVLSLSLLNLSLLKL